MPIRNQAHQNLVQEILLEFGSKPYLRLWANNTGAVKTDGRFIRFGLVGSSDIIGILDSGRFLAIEVKTGRARQTAQQKSFEAMITKYGGLYILARSVEDVEKKLTSYLKA